VKKIIISLCLLSVLFISGTSYADTALKKLGRGMANVLTCPIELPYRIGQANEESGPFAAFTWGALDGFFRMTMRFIVGMYEIGTFPIPFPQHYEPIIDDPEFFLEENMF
jgi:putative exosortase-associated protein (TIGR04073 family)